MQSVILFTSRGILYIAGFAYPTLTSETSCAVELFSSEQEKEIYFFTLVEIDLTNLVFPFVESWVDDLNFFIIINIVSLTQSSDI